jgi:hypothetical protein
MKAHAWVVAFFCRSINGSSSLPILPIPGLLQFGLKPHQIGECGGRSLGAGAVDGIQAREQLADDIGEGKAPQGPVEVRDGAQCGIKLIP